MGIPGLRVDGLRVTRQRFLAQLKDPKIFTAQRQSAIHYGLAWTTLQQREFSAAWEHQRQAAQLIRGHRAESSAAILLDHLHLQILLASAENAEQKKELDRFAVQAAARHRDSRAVIRSAILARLSADGAADEVAALARAAAQQWPGDPQIWALLARAESARGRRAAQHAALAERYALAGALAAAIEQLTLARSAGDADFVTLSRIDARLTSMRALLRREQIERQQSGGKN